MTASGLVVRLACEDDLDEIGAMVQDFVRGHKAEHHVRPREMLREAYFGARAVARLLVAEKGDRIVGMGQWSPVFEMFWAMRGGRPEYLYVRPEARGLGVAAAILAAICDDVRRAGGEYLWAAYDDARAPLYERVTSGAQVRECHLSGEAFQELADHDDARARLYERVASGAAVRECHLSGEAFQRLADLAGQRPRDIVCVLPSRELNWVPAGARSRGASPG